MHSKSPNGCVPICTTVQRPQWYAIGGFFTVFKVSVGGREGCHDLTGVRRQAKSVEAGDDQALGGRDQPKDANHREATVVDLGQERLFLPLWGHLLGEPERVKQVEWHRVRVALERREDAGLATADIVDRARICKCRWCL